MSKKKDLVIQEEIDKCLRYFSEDNNNNKVSARTTFEAFTRSANYFR